MMGLDQIKAMDEEAEEKARMENKRPYVAVKDNDPDVNKAPFIGELALTFSQFLNKVKKGKGYALRECGQFQVYIAEFVKEA